MNVEPAEEEATKGNILVVDDTPANLRLLTTILTSRGYQVRPVLKGQLALTAAQSSPPDLILLDISMPEMDGYEVCNRLKAAEKTRAIPIIFISAIDDMQNKLKAFKAGGVDYITKPFQVEEVLARVETHLTLRFTQQELQQRVQELNTFSRTVAHDLKNPINIIASYSQLLRIDFQEQMAGTAAQEYIDAIHSMVFKMNSIIEELMLLAGLRKTKVTIDPLDMALIVSEAEKRLMDIMSESQVKIIYPASWPTALGYAPWIEEVWVNYISNAIKYGGKPPVIELGATEEADNMVCFWVRDNGIGLTPEQQAVLFTPFERLEQTRIKGHGLGLSIVQQIIEKQGGHVGVQSQVNHGSVFKFFLPRAN